MMIHTRLWDSIKRYGRRVRRWWRTGRSKTWAKWAQVLLILIKVALVVYELLGRMGYV